jgi:uncharacterized protein (TIGR02145 family)
MTNANILPLKKSFPLWLCIILFTIPAGAQNVGIHTTTPLAKLHVDLGASLSNGILFSGLDPSGGSFPSLGAGHRLMYYPGKVVFRAGYVDDTQWDNSQVGSYSFAFGYNPIAKGNASCAIGDAVYAGGTISTAFGNSTSTKGYSSFVMGMYNDPLLNGPDQNVETPQTPLLMVGNGDGNATRNNALAVFKNGDFLLRNYSTVLIDPGIKLPPVTGPGTRMMWMVEKSAFRLGTVHNNDWNADSIGTWSTGIGYSTKAKGQFSLALGLQTTASGITSTALGYNTKASGENSLSSGSVTIASGNVSTAMGLGTIASGLTSTALGYSTKASGENSFSSGSVTTAKGANSTSLGFKTYAHSYGSVALGRFNDSIAISNPTGWITTDPLMMLGNGTSDASPHNTLVIYKNGIIISKNPTLVNVNPGVIPLPVNGPGTRMMWIPEKGAFRAGTVDNNDWDADSLGSWSTGLGFSTNAKGPASFAAGFTSTASGVSSAAFGYSTLASGENAIAMGSAAIASGPVATAMGLSTTASGLYSIAMGSNTKATGTNTTAMGFKTYSRSYGSMAIGRYNDRIPTSDSLNWNPSDPLLIIGNGTSDANTHNAMVVYKNANMVVKNPTAVLSNPGVMYVPISGAGTRMMWIPEKSAFRIGTVENANWNADSIGTWSASIGYNTKAKGLTSLALGNQTTASGTTSTAMGYGTAASGENSIAMGSISVATGAVATAMGSNTKSQAFATTTMGFGTIANGAHSTSMGYGSLANGAQSTAMGFDSRARGNISNASGLNSIAKGYASTVIGIYNDSILLTNQTSIDPLTPLFIVGNGNGFGVGQRSNAMVVRKDGNVGIGTSSPGSKLHINGAVKIADGTQGAGKVLTSDATGLASWQSPSSPPPPPAYSNSVTICCQSWMTKNLDVSTYRNGDAIPKVTNDAAWAGLTTGAYCYYNNDSTTYAATYGKIYNWYAVNDPRGLAPEGWHIPTAFEWTTLVECLGGDAVAGGPLKEIGTSHWMSPNTGATNVTGYTGLPGGQRLAAGGFINNGTSNIWWSSVEFNSTLAWFLGVGHTTSSVVLSYIDKPVGSYVRCIRD